MNTECHDNAITCEARALFRNLIETLVNWIAWVLRPLAISPSIFSRSGPLIRDAKLHSQQFFDAYRLRAVPKLRIGIFTASHRHKFTSRLDLSRAKTYSEAAQIALEAMMLAGLALVFSALEVRSTTWRQISAGRAWASN